jgi:hypothetical protein
MADNLEIEKISQLPQNDSVLGSNDEFIVNREISPGVVKTRRGKYGSIFGPLISGVQTAISDAANALGIANSANAWIANPISSDPGNNAILGTDNKIFVPTPTPPPPSTFERESDFQSPYQYCGYAPAGSLTSQAVWEIDRINVNLDGTVLVQSASNVAWDNRYTVIYT